MFIPNAVERAEARVTIRNMGTLRRPAMIVAALGFVVLAACGDSGSDGDVSAMTADHKAAQALAAIDELQDHADDLSKRIADLENQRSDMKDRIERVAARLQAALDQLLESVSERKGAIDSATSAANDALTRAQSALDGLSVLENRFDYHLKHSGEG